MIILIVIIIIVAIFFLIIKKVSNLDDLQENNKIEDQKNIENEIETYKKYYKPRIYITTLNEMKFYNVLLEIAKELDYILFTQVSLYNIVSMNEELDYSTRTKYFNKIASKSIDFVLVDKKCRIKLCIELDDNTHKKKSRIERDNFINKLFQDLEINLLRYPVYNVYYKETLKKRIQKNIKEIVY